MTYLTLMLMSVGVVLDLLTSKLNPLYVVVDECLQRRSNKYDKGIHSIIHSNINCVIDQGVSHKMSNDLHIYGNKTHNLLLIECKGRIQPLKSYPRPSTTPFSLEKLIAFRHSFSIGGQPSNSQPTTNQK